MGGEEDMSTTVQDRYGRAMACAVRLFKLRTIVLNGTELRIDQRFTDLFRGWLMLAWLRGYRAGRADQKKKAQ